MNNRKINNFNPNLRVARERYLPFLRKVVKKGNVRKLKNNVNKEITKEIINAVIEVQYKLNKLRVKLDKRDIPIELFAKTNHLLEGYPEDSQQYFKNIVNIVINEGVKES